MVPSSLLYPSLPRSAHEGVTTGGEEPVSWLRRHRLPGSESQLCHSTAVGAWVEVINFSCTLVPSSVKSSKSVMVNFMCQLDWDTRCPDIWSNIILGVSLRVSWVRLTFGKLSKADCTPDEGGSQRISWQPSRAERLALPWARGESPCLTAFELGHFPCPWTQTKTLALPGSQVCWLSDWNLLCRQLRWVCTCQL